MDLLMIPQKIRKLETMGNKFPTTAQKPLNSDDMIIQNMIG
jgi:hypothetical protein